MSTGIFWIEPKLFTEVADCEVLFTLFAINETAIFIGERVSWVESDRIVEVTDRTVVVALLSVGEAAAVVGSCEFRIKPDRRLTNFINTPARRWWHVSTTRVRIAR